MINIIYLLAFVFTKLTFRYKKIDKYTSGKGVLENNRVK